MITIIDLYNSIENSLREHFEETQILHKENSQASSEYLGIKFVQKITLPGANRLRTDAYIFNIIYFNPLAELEIISQKSNILNLIFNKPLKIYSENPIYTEIDTVSDTLSDDNRRLCLEVRFKLTQSVEEMFSDTDRFGSAINNNTLDEMNY